MLYYNITGLFYADNGQVAGTDAAQVQQGFELLVGLFASVSLEINSSKTSLWSAGIMPTRLISLHLLTKGSSLELETCTVSASGRGYNAHNVGLHFKRDVFQSIS